ncbi:hypothetical protein Bca52824_029279 [Brassica carinata]|uniref:Pectinesterase inhibitor domain-containing protein n=1 Tax=Brassica carinata TaxID=52824 RepID=A0A8X7VE05_BRACI|nr:hypothetical protein Bca52824_029279 [Brassica carinata]
MNHALRARSLAFNLTLSHRTAELHIVDPIHDCLELLDDTIEMLSRITSSDDEEDVHTWLSATLTNQDTCEQSLQEKSNSYNHGIAMDFVAKTYQRHPKLNKEIGGTRARFRGTVVFEEFSAVTGNTGAVVILLSVPLRISFLELD